MYGIHAVRECCRHSVIPVIYSGFEMAAVFENSGCFEAFFICLLDWLLLAY
jgi:hypothetical protein